MGPIESAVDFTIHSVSVLPVSYDTCKDLIGFASAFNDSPIPLNRALPMSRHSRLCHLTYSDPNTVPGLFTPSVLLKNVQRSNLPNKPQITPKLSLTLSISVLIFVSFRAYFPLI